MINETHLTPKALEAQSFTDLDLSPKLCKHNLWGCVYNEREGENFGVCEPTFCNHTSPPE